MNEKALSTPNAPSLGQDELDQALTRYEESLQQASSREIAIEAERGHFIQRFMNLCHGDWLHEIELIIHRLANAGHGAEVSMNQEAWQEMLVVHIKPKTTKQTAQNQKEFDYQVRIFPNEAMLRACFYTITPEVPPHAVHQDTFRLEDLTPQAFRALLIRYICRILESASPR